MDVFQAIQERRAVKHFDPAHRLTDSEVNTLLEAARLSPTAFNIQNWRFVLLRDPEHRQAVREAAWNQAQVTDASLVIVMCADLKAWEKEPQRYWRNAPQEIQDYMVKAIDGYYRGKEQTQRDECLRSIGLAAQSIMLSAKAMGYDSCPMDGFDFDAVGKLINLPDDHIIGMMVAVGKKTQEARPRGGSVSPEDVIFYDRFA